MGTLGIRSIELTNLNFGLGYLNPAICAELL